MKLLSTSILLLSLGLLTLPTRAGLYDDDAAKITTGDINNQDYWWTKFDMMMLDKAIEQRQPEGRIAVDLASTSNRLNDLVKAYPKHEGIQAWKKKVDDINKKLDPNADRGAAWKPGCPWDEANFAQAWVNFHWGKMQIADKEMDKARGTWQNVVQNFEILTRPDRLKDYPDDLKKWVDDSKDEVAKTAEQLKQR